MTKSIEHYLAEYDNKHIATIIYAYEKGYVFDFEEQCVISPSGNKSFPKLYGKQRYPSLTINDGTGTKSNITFNYHKFAAYSLYGFAALEKGVNVRHLDGNVLNLSKENLLLGTSQENQFDKSQNVRKNAAVLARKSQGIRPVTCNVSDELAEKILKEYLLIKGNLKRAKRGTICSLMSKYNLPRTTVTPICTGYSFPDIYKRIINEIHKS